ncbi:hypothetical protein CK203_054017 [Vitis vinifera]|uniref:Uncharacterized protein n=1 Tax=Vitis vinifera TaxID=29760 RepID=A0A438GUL8_VITVI|nr:hypothetical protein CK203_054017 [Vitis vinifera]
MIPMHYRWVRAVDEFFNVLHSTQFIHRKKEVRECSLDFKIEPL